MPENDTTSSVTPSETQQAGTATQVTTPPVVGDTTQPELKTQATTPPVVGDTTQPETRAQGADGIPDNWLPEDLRGNERLKDFKSPEELARAYAKAELAQATPEKYEAPQGTPTQLQEWAKKNKLTQSQFTEMINLERGFRTHQQKVVENVSKKGREVLFTDWGGDKDENLRVANAVFDAIPSGKQLATLIKTSKAGGNPVVIKALHEIGSYLKEGGHLKNMRVSNGKGNPLMERYPTMFKQE